MCLVNMDIHIRNVIIFDFYLKLHITALWIIIDNQIRIIEV